MICGEFQSAFGDGQCFFRSACVGQRAGKVLQSVQIIRIKCDSLPEVVDGQQKSPDADVEDSQRVVHVSGLRLKSDSSPQMLGSHLALPEFHRDDTEQMMCVGILRIENHRPPQRRFGLHLLTRPQQSQALLHQRPNLLAFMHQSWSDLKLSEVNAVDAAESAAPPAYLVSEQCPDAPQSKNG
jgi:hypothetical protein